MNDLEYLVSVNDYNIESTYRYLCSVGAKPKVYNVPEDWLDFCDKYVINYKPIVKLDYFDGKILQVTKSTLRGMKMNKEKNKELKNC